MTPATLTPAPLTWSTPASPRAADTCWTTYVVHALAVELDAVAATHHQLAAVLADTHP